MFCSWSFNSSEVKHFIWPWLKFYFIKKLSWCLYMLYLQEELWFRAWHNPHCRFSNKVNCSMRNMWEACIFYAEKDRGKAGWVNRRIWGVHAGLPAALCQWTGSHGNSKMCPGISQSWMYLSHIIWSTSLHSAFLLDEQDTHSTKAVTLYVQVVLVDS